ncbi:Putative ribonuclease H protein At1g65750 [Linum perenne]
MWNSDFLFSVLPRDVAMQVIGMSPPKESLGKDSMVWGLEPDGKFSIRSAFQMLNDVSSESGDPIWPLIWRWHGPTQLIAWRPGEEGWATLNTDGSRLHRSGATAIGGLIRDERGKFVRAFCANVGDCSITRAELRAIVEGVKMAWNLGFRKVAVQTDSRAAIAILQTGIGLTSQHAALVAEFHELKMKDWEISLSHIYREANCATDHLANFGHSFCVGLYEFNTPDSSLASWLRHDLLGVALPRVVSNNN